VAKFNASMDKILTDGQEYLEDMELAESNVQAAYTQYREQVCACVMCVFRGAH
jgi:hypothetical protein